MRPSNLNEVAYSVVKGMDRSLGRSVQPTEDVTREGSRKGSRKGEVYDWDYIDYEAIAGELEKLGEDPWELDFDEIYDLAESKGLTPDMFTREGSRKGMDVDGYFNVVAQNHGLDISKAIKVRNEMNEEGILPDTEEFIELSKKHGVDPNIMQNVVDDFAERYLM